jgi:molecular chaperone GrpE
MVNEATSEQRPSRWGRVWLWFKGYALSRAALPRQGGKVLSAPPSVLLSAAQAAHLRATPEHIGGLQRLVEGLQHEVAALRTQVETTLPGSMEALEKQVSRAGREQFKSNSLNEAQMERLSEALDMLRNADARREEDMQALQAQMQASQAAARLDVVQALLPVLDSLDEAMRSGRALLEQPIETPEPPSLLERLRGQATPDMAAVQALREAMDSWLVGLSFVQQRLLEVLAAEGVRPIEAQGQPFDPQRHVALDVVAPSNEVPPGMVADELRRGYLADSRVLRHAEVMVARTSDDAVNDEALEHGGEA